jgi:hypothetical protein
VPVTASSSVEAARQLLQNAGPQSFAESLTLCQEAFVRIDRMHQEAQAGLT